MLDEKLPTKQNQEIGKLLIISVGTLPRRYQIGGHRVEPVGVTSSPWASRQVCGRQVQPMDVTSSTWASRLARGRHVKPVVVPLNVVF